MNIKKSIICFFLSFTFVFNTLNFRAYAFSPIPVVAGASAAEGVGAEILAGSCTVPPVAVAVGVTALVIGTTYGVYKMSNPAFRAKVWTEAQSLGQQAYDTGAIVVDGAGRCIIKSKSWLDSLNSFMSSVLSLDGIPNSAHSGNIGGPKTFNVLYTPPCNGKTYYVTVSDFFRSYTTSVYGGSDPWHFVLEGTPACELDLEYWNVDHYNESFCTKFKTVPSLTSVSLDNVALPVGGDFAPDTSQPTAHLGDDEGSAVGITVPGNSVPSCADDMANIKPIDASAISVDSTYKDNSNKPTDTGFWGTLFGWLAKILAAITAIPGVIGTIATAIQGFPTFATNVWGALKAFPDYMSNVWKVLEAMPGTIGMIATGVADLPGCIPALKDFITDLPTTMAQNWTNLKDWVTDLPGEISGAFPALKDWITDIPGEVIDGLKELFIPDSIPEPFENIIDDLKQKIHVKYDPILPVDKANSLKSGQEQFKDITINYNLNLGILNLGSGTAVIISAKQINSHITDVRLLTSVVMSFFFFFYVYSEIYFAIRGVKPFETSNKDVTSKYSDCGGDKK